MKKEKRKSGVSVVGDVPWGTHLCQFYKTKEDLLDILIPYFKTGLENNEFCMWVTSEPLNVEEAKTALGKVVKNLDDYIKKGQIEILDYRSWYVKSKKFDSDRVLKGWVEKEKYALQNGFDGLRLTGNTFWLVKNDWDDFKGYEETVNDVIDKHRMIAICSYSLEKCNASEIIDVVSNHQFAIIRRENKWNIIESSKRKKAEEMLNEKTILYETLVNTSPEAITVTDLEGRITYLSTQTLKLLGYERAEELLGHNAFEFIAPEDHEKAKIALQQTFINSGIRNFECTAVRKDGTRIILEESTVIIRDSMGNPKSFMAIAREITDRKKAEGQLKESEERFRILFDDAPAGIALVDKNGIIQEANNSLLRLLQIRKEEFIGRNFVQLAPAFGLDVTENITDFKNRLDEKPPKREITFLNRNNNKTTINVQSSTIKSGDEILGILYYIEDITERKKAQEEIKSLAKFPAENPNPVLRIKKDGEVVYSNKAGFQVLDFWKMNIGEEVPERWRNIIRKKFASKNLKAEEEEEEEELNDKIFSFVISPVGDEGYVNLYGRDITEHKKAEEALKKSHQLLNDTGEMAKVGGWELDLSTNEVSWTEEVGRIHGVEPGYNPKLEEALNFYAPESRSAVEAVVKKAAETGEPYDLESLFIPQGSKDKIWVRSLGKAVYSGSRIVKLVGTFQNIDKYKRADEALRESEMNYRELANSIKDVFFAMDKDLKYIYWNKASEKLTGIEVKDAIGKSIFEIFPDTEDTKKAITMYREAIKTQQPKNFVNEYQLKDKKIFFEISAYPSKNGLSVFVKDITERKKIEEEIRYLKDYNENILESNPNPIMVVKGKQIEYVNKSFISAFGETKKEYITKNLKDVVPSEISPVFENLLQEDGRSKDLKFRGKEYIVYSFIIKKAEEEEEEEARSGIIFQDITERKQAEETLTQQNEALSQLNRFSIELSMLSPEDNLEAFIVKQIKEITGAEVAIFSHYNPANRTITLQHIEMDPGLLEKVVSLLGKQVTKIHSVVSDEMYREMTTEIIGGRRTLHEASFGAISRPVGAAIQTLLKVDRFIGLAYIIEGELYGTSLLAMKKGQPDPPKQIVENFIFLATVSLRRRRAENALQQSEEKYRILFNDVPVGIGIVDESGRVVDCNQYLAEIFGMTFEEFKAINVKSLYANPKDRERLQNLLNKEGKVIDWECTLKRKDGTAFFAILNTEVIEREGQKLNLTTMRDITERKVAEEKIKSQNVQLKKLDDVKTDFLNTTSHELRTPVASIKGYIQMLLKQTLGEITEEQKKALEVLLRNTNRLDHLIQDILDISRLESGTMKFITEKTDATKMIKEIAETMQVSADLKRIKIKIDIQEGIPDLMIDQERIKQVLMNLVDNAIKFSPDGSMIHIKARKEKEDVLFEVQDFGRGIPKNKQKKIFERFYQVDSGIDRKFGGVGLGLTISKKIIDTYGGQIWVDSTLGKGSSFKFSLPMQSTKNSEGDLQEIFMEWP